MSLTAALTVPTAALFSGATITKAWPAQPSKRRRPQTFPCFSHQPHNANTYWVPQGGPGHGGRKIAGSMVFGSCSLQAGTGRTGVWSRFLAAAHKHLSAHVDHVLHPSWPQFSIQHLPAPCGVPKANTKLLSNSERDL